MKKLHWLGMMVLLLIAAALVAGCAQNTSPDDPPQQAPADVTAPEPPEQTGDQEQSASLEERQELYERLLEEEHDGDQWAAVEDCGELLSLPEGSSPAAYFESIQQQAEEQAGVYISEQYMPWAERFQRDYGGKTEAASYFEDYRINSLIPGGVYTRDGAPYLVYTLDFSLLAAQGAELSVYDGMEVDEDGWLDPGPETVLALTVEADGPRLSFGQQFDIFPDNAEHFPEGFFQLLAMKEAGLLSVDTGDEDVREPDIQVDPQANMMGSGESVVEIGPNVGFADEMAELPETLPIYINEYAYDQAGPMYEVTDDVKAAISANLTRYLECLYGADAAQKAEVLVNSDREFDVYYLSGSTELRSSINRIGVLSSDYPISSDITDEELLENPLVAAGMAYLGMKDPIVTRSVDYKLNGTEDLRRYRIWENTNDAFRKILNRSFGGITVLRSAGSENVIVEISNPPELIKYADYSVRPYASALAELSERYPNMDTQDVRAEVFYSAGIHPGYFVPFLRVYIKDGVMTQSTDTRYTAVDVVLLDKSAD